jgi:hypothetical protein
MTATNLQLAMSGHIEHASRIDRRIAMEAGFLSSFVTTVREVIPSMLTSISDALTSLSFSSSDKRNTGNYSSFLNLLDKSNFMEIGDVKISVPEGFTGHLPTYVDTLKMCSEHAGKIASDVLLPYNTFLSQLLSSDNTRLSSMGQLNYLVKRDSEREELNSKIGNFLRKGSTQVKQPMKDVFSRNAEWELVLTNQNTAINELGKTDRKTVQDMVDQCVELIEAVRSSAESGELDNLSGPMIKQLSASTMSVANEVTFYSITLYRVNAMDKIINDSISILTEELKK